MTEWFNDSIPLLTLIAAVCAVGAALDTQKKIDRLQKQVEHLHNKLYDAGAFDRDRS